MGSGFEAWQSHFFVLTLNVQLWERGGSFIPQNCDGEQPQY